MSGTPGLDIVIVDYGLGNLYSVQRACERAGLVARISSSPEDLRAARGAILPGVGAFGDAMANLRALGLVDPLRQLARAGKPLVGICLGFQLLMSESHEFGRHEGLDIIPGSVVHFGAPKGARGSLKVPQVGWNRVRRIQTGRGVEGNARDPWNGTPLENIQDGAYMYFVHSYYVRPGEPAVAIAATRYGDIEFCSAARQENVFGFQFHPERSGCDGIRIYQRIADLLESSEKTREKCHAA